MLFHRAPDPRSGGADIREVNHAIAGIAVESVAAICCGLKPFSSGLNTVCSGRAGDKSTLQHSGQVADRYRLDDKSKQHIIDIAVDMLAAG